MLPRITTQPSIIRRIVVGKSVGLVFGAMAYASLSYLFANPDELLGIGLILWYVTLGGVIGISGVFNQHAILVSPIPWWFRAPVIGGWMNFVLTFFTYQQMEAVLVSLFGIESKLSNPFWFVMEGAVVGLLIGFCATKAGGEGKETLDV
ncbi:hypothetical protein [Kiloniella sp. b19]|uniref:hypothetical protein n=1 Tax=Kiloniella sp. GXU_MW_B19 TaxID=3141326 RepID=UPI0031DD1E2E